MTSMYATAAGHTTPRRSICVDGNHPGHTTPRRSISAVDELVDFTSKNENWKHVQQLVVALFQGKKISGHEIRAGTDNLNVIINSPLGNFLQEYYNDQLLKRGMIILRYPLRSLQGMRLINRLGETWDFFYAEILPLLQAIFYKIESKTLPLRKITMKAFKEVVVYKLPLLEVFTENQRGVEHHVKMRQMLLMLQTSCERGAGVDARLQQLLPFVVRPYLGQAGLFVGPGQPCVRSNLSPTEEPASPSIKLRKPRDNIRPSSAQTLSLYTENESSPKSGFLRDSTIGSLRLPDPKDSPTLLQQREMQLQQLCRFPRSLTRVSTIDPLRLPDPKDSTSLMQQRETQLQHRETQLQKLSDDIQLGKPFLCTTSASANQNAEEIVHHPLRPTSAWTEEPVSRKLTTHVGAQAVTHSAAHASAPKSLTKNSVLDPLIECASCEETTSGTQFFV